MRLILASRSPRRAELLAAAGFTFEIAPPDVDESTRPDEPPRDYVLRVARTKAEQIARHRRQPDALVLGADTVVVADGRAMGKPMDAAEATAMLRALSGAVHEVHTGLYLCSAAENRTEVVTTRVSFLPMTEHEIAWYVDTGEPMDKAGAYGIQGRASRFIDRIDGSWSNVVGLPIATVYRLLSGMQGPD
jgi:septum formation protein